MSKENKSFVIIGLGGFGGIVATELARFGNYVLGIDIEPRKVADMAEHLSEAVILDATDEAALREAGVSHYDVGLVSIGGDLEGSILATLNLRLNGVQTIWAKAANQTHHRILSKMGVDRVVLPATEMGQHTAQILNNPAVQDYINLGNGFSVVNLLISAKMAGTLVSDLPLESGITRLGVMRGTEFFDISQSDLAIEENDRLLLLGKRADLTAFGDKL